MSVRTIRRAVDLFRASEPYASMEVIAAPAGNERAPSVLPGRYFAVAEYLEAARRGSPGDVALAMSAVHGRERSRDELRQAAALVRRGLAALEELRKLTWLVGESQ